MTHTKRTAALAMLLALIMLFSAILSACGDAGKKTAVEADAREKSEKREKKKKSVETEDDAVYLTIKDGDTVLYGPAAVDAESGATVTDVVFNYLDSRKPPVEYETQERTLAGKVSVHLKSVASSAEDDDRFWQVRINGKTTMFEATVEVGDEVVVFLDRNADTTTEEPETTEVPAIQTAGDDFND